VFTPPPATIAPAMYERFATALRRADGAEFWLALAPVFLLLLPAMPYVSYPVIMFIKAPMMLHSHWMLRSVWGIVGWLACAVFALGTARWAQRLGQARARELLAKTDVLLYAMMHDGTGQVQEPPKTLLSQELLPAPGQGLGAYEQRLLRLGTHFDRWCAAVGKRYEPRAVRRGLVLSFLPTLAVLTIFVAFPNDSGVWLLLGLAPLLYHHAASCGLRSGARRALAEFFGEG
jgi:hypothetical protein